MTGSVGMRVSARSQAGTSCTLRRPWDDEDDEPVVYLMEIGPDGRRVRQVGLAEDGTALRSGPDDWPFNPPIVDLFDPALAGQEISQREFEDQWAGARQVGPER
ncbi:hypothetical protein [Streptomyces sp. NPDC054787]